MRARCEELVKKFEATSRYSTNENSGLTIEDVRYMCENVSKSYPDLQFRIEAHLLKNDFVPIGETAH